MTQRAAFIVEVNVPAGKPIRHLRQDIADLLAPTYTATVRTTRKDAYRQLLAFGRAVRLLASAMQHVRIGGFEGPWTAPIYDFLAQHKDLTR